MNLTVTHGLLGLQIALIAGLAALWVGPDGQLRNTHWQAPSALPPDFSQMLPQGAPGVAQDAAAAVVAILDRPLFSPNRRPPPPPPPADAPPDPMANIQLMGIFGSGTRGGILARVDGKSRRVMVDDSVGAWTLKSIEDRSATFASGTESRSLVLMKAKPGANAAPPMAGGPTIEPIAKTGNPAADLRQAQMEEERQFAARRNAERIKMGLRPLP